MTVVEFNHYSVMLHETIEQLNINPDGIYVDGTFYGIDQDDAAIAAASARLQPFGDKVTVIRNNYVNAVEALREYGVTGVDGIVLDLGVSSYQLDTEDRGFSYRFDAPLDMRMDRRQTLTARDIVNNYSEMELYHIIRDYGEDPFAKNIAKHIVKNRADKPIETTFELNEIIKAAVPAKMRQNGHPSKQTFQAIRIECNQELEVLKKALDELTALGYGKLPVCIAKTQYSFSDNAKLTGAPEGHTLNVREVRLSAGAGFVVVVCGSIMTMPGLPKHPAAMDIDVDVHGKITGLF